MISFQDLFEKSDQHWIYYNNRQLFWADKFLVASNATLRVTIEETNSDYRQGISIDIVGQYTINEQTVTNETGSKLLFWEDDFTKPFEIQIKPTTGFVWVQNIWEIVDYQGNCTTNSGVNGAAMIIEKIENGKRYRCNDGNPNDDFNDIVFTIQQVS